MMTRKTLTPIAIGFAALFSLAACGGTDDAAGDSLMADTGMGAMPAPAPAPATDTMAPRTDSLPTDTTRDTTRRDTTTTPPPGA
jgi:hypothetical protein